MALGDEANFSTELDVHRTESPIDSNGYFNRIEYVENSDRNTERVTRVATRVKVFRKPSDVMNRIEERRQWKHFGKAKEVLDTYEEPNTSNSRSNQKGSQPTKYLKYQQRGVTGISHEEVKILDPFSEEAKKTDDEKLIDKIQERISNSKKLQGKEKSSE